MGFIERLFGRARTQHCLLLTEDGRILVTGMNAELGYVVDESHKEAWGLLPDCTFTKRDTNTPYVLLCERKTAPYSPRKSKWESIPDKTINAIARERHNQAAAEVARDNRKQRQVQAICLAITVLSLTLAFVVVAGLLSGGQLKLPW